MDISKTNRLLLIATLLAFASCEQKSDSKIVQSKPPIPQAVVESKKESGKASEKESGKASDQALAFLNAYVADCNKEEGSLGIAAWVKSSKLATNRFKKEVKTMLDEAYKEDPELGLDADPLFDAQDYPDKGFELASFDSKTNYVVVKGKNWPDFKLTMKMVLENNTWLVDGCGVINIPAAKRIHR